MFEQFQELFSMQCLMFTRIYMITYSETVQLCAPNNEGFRIRCLFGDDTAVGS